MLTCKTFYKLFLLVKYKGDKYAKEKMKIIADDFISSKKVLTPRMEVAIEKEIFGRPLNWRHRRVNNTVLSNGWIIKAFLEEERDKEGLVELSASVRNIAREIYNSLSPEGKARAREAGLI